MSKKCNTGEGNSGEGNSGNRNTGNWNTGSRNSGNGNFGYWNSGYRNSGNKNSGDCNSGNCNSGNWNSGDCNSGSWNSGNRNTGSWNSGDRHTGYMNTEVPPIRIFNRDTDVQIEDIEFPDFFYFDLLEWIDSDAMTDDEKEAHPEHETTGGYLRTYEYKEAWQRSWDKAPEADRAKLFDLPNFDANIFYEITGIDVRETAGKPECDDIITINGVEYRKVEQ